MPIKDEANVDMFHPAVRQMMKRDEVIAELARRREEKAAGCKVVTSGLVAVASTPPGFAEWLQVGVFTSMFKSKEVEGVPLSGTQARILAAGMADARVGNAPTVERQGLSTAQWAGVVMLIIAGLAVGGLFAMMGSM